MTQPVQANPPGPLRVLGIDPGLADVGFGVIDWSPQSSTARLVDYGVIQTRPGFSLAERLDQIYRQLSAVIDKFSPTVASIEQLFFAKNVKTAMVVAHGRAACILATARCGLLLCEYTPLQIKQALTGHGRASKMQVQLMVRAVLALEEIPRPDHAADALAAALCYVHSMALDEKIGLAQAKTQQVQAGRSGLVVSATPDEDEAVEARKLLLAQSRSNRRRR